MNKWLIYDRRNIAKNRSSGNKQRFLQRIKKNIKDKALSIIGSKIGESHNSSDIIVDPNTVEEPTFIYDDMALHGNIVLPGNFRYIKGDEFELVTDKRAKGYGTSGSENGGPQDDFVVNISRKEFYDYFFEDCELPNLDKKFGINITELEKEHAGYVTVGPPNRLAVVRSLINAKGRRNALTGKWKKKIKQLKEELERLEKEGLLTNEKREEILKEIRRCNIKINGILFLDDIDLRFKTDEFRPKKKAEAAIFFLMDISGSMNETHKSIARKFFAMLYAFVDRKYKNPDVIFVIYADAAKQVDEQYFFTTKDSGGTVVSKGYALIEEIIRKKYNIQETNIYISHATDGDNYTNDNEIALDILKHKLLPLVQHFSYLEIRLEAHIGYMYGSTPMNTFWDSLEELRSKYLKNFSIQFIENESQIYQVFRKFFAKNVK